MDQLRIGVIGGWGVPDTEHGRLTALCDINPAVRERVRQRTPHVKTYADYHELAGDKNVDLVYVCTPNWVHAEQAVACLKAGKHVFLEKPMTVRRDEAAPLLKAEKESGKTLVVDFEMRFSLLLGQRLPALVRDGEIGRLVGVNIEHYRGAWVEEGNGIWRSKPEKSGGLFFMEICHNLDYLRLLLGEVVEVQSFKMENVLSHYRIPDNVQTHLLFENGTVGSITSSHTRSANDRGDYKDWMQAGHHDQISIIGTEGSLILDIWKQTVTVLRLEEYPPHTGARRVRLVRCEDFSNLSQNELSHDMMGYLHDFIRRMATGQPPVQTAEDAWRTHAVCLACEESALTKGFPRMQVDYSPL
jgi:predicted dehydrogenase